MDIPIIHFVYIFDSYFLVSFGSITYTVYSMNKTEGINKCTYSVECRRDSPPDGADEDDDDDSLPVEKIRIDVSWIV